MPTTDPTSRGGQPPDGSRLPPGALHAVLVAEADGWYRASLVVRVPPAAQGARSEVTTELYLDKFDPATGWVELGTAGTTQEASDLGGPLDGSAAIGLPGTGDRIQVSWSGQMDHVANLAFADVSFLTERSSGN
jgi:hypothetical protein